MIAKIYINGVIGEDVTLLNVMHQFTSYENPTSVEVIIDSVGGSVDTGQSIFSYLRKLGIPVTTKAKMAYSIASTIFMAGDKRIVLDGSDRIMIHMPFVQNATGGRQELENIAKELKTIENEFVDFYSNYIKADVDSIRDLLNNDTFISGKEALSLGLATELEIPLQAVAFLVTDDKEEVNSKSNNIMKKANTLIKALKDFVKPTSVALVLQDANGVEITFPDVEEGSPSVGDIATVDGSPASGEYVSPTGETWVFDGGSLTEVKPAEEMEEEVEVEEVAEVIEEEVEVVEDTIEEEEVVEEEEMEMTSTELQELLTELFMKAKTETTTEVSEIIATLKKDNETLNAELVAVRKLIGSDDFQIEEDEKKPTVKLSKSERAVQILNSRKNK